MGAERRLDILRAVLEASVLQRRLFDERRFEELVFKQKEREALFAELATLGPMDVVRKEAEALVKGILESDRVLTLSMESAKADIAGKLGRISKGAIMMKAYGSASR
ncbi:MAG: hypothetical protein HY955_05185 [Deltaproteobacteria bacterium]|nr:hypothetical protein [Deltaproteobacteria bacterium]